MATDIKYWGKTVTAEDIAFRKKLIADNPGDSQRALSFKLCKDQPQKQTRSIEAVCGYPLAKNFRERITVEDSA